MQTEIVVLGAGIAGLLLGSELALHHDVIVVEKAAMLPKTKYWLTDRGSAELNPEFQPALDSVYPAMAFTAYEGTSYLAPGDFRLWDSEKLLATLMTKLTRGKGRIVFGHRFYSLNNAGRRTFVYANDVRIECRLVIDCMGVESPIIYAKNVVDILGFYLLYGATFQLQGTITPVALHNLILSHQPGWVEAFPTSQGQLHLILIVPTRQLRPASDLKADFTFIATKSPYAANIVSPTTDRQFLGGIVPVARMRRRAIDRVFFYGEAGQVNPAASATALTRMLYNYRAVARHLSDCLRRDQLSGSALSTNPTHDVSPLNQRIQRALFRGILRWNSDDYLQIVRELIRLDDTAFANHLMFGGLPDSVVDLSRYAARLWESRSTRLLKMMLRGLVLPLI
jgi:2-polyprenyl-6-methoxyphenol hydroxylase-like FAD-dependent oxidoreductase